MKKPVIAIDIDDVIADSTEALRLAVNERYGAKLTPEDYKIRADYGGYYERVWAAHNLEHASYDDLHEDMTIDQSHILLLPGVSFAIGELSKRFDIILITARNPAWEKATKDWLTKHFGNIFTAVHFAGRSKKDTSSLTKGELCQKAGAVLLIDDNVEHCRSALACGIEAILFGDYGWHNDKTDGLTVCRNWQSILEYVDARSW